VNLRCTREHRFQTLQGGAENLIGGKPRERFEVMQGVVDVERY
jgi:hypothetical protein